MTESPQSNRRPVRRVGVSAEIAAYVDDHTTRPDPITERLAVATREQFGDLAGMNIDADQGLLLAMLVRLADAHLVFEIGTFTGMSALWMARALPKGGRLVCFDITDEFLGLARNAWSEADVEDRIEVVIGPATQTIAAYPTDAKVDLAFVDADKPGYAHYVDLLLPRLSDRGVIVVDNVLWSGRVLDPTDLTESTVALREFNDAVVRRSDIAVVMLPVGDGITLIQRC